MKVLGVDPGTWRTGVGIVAWQNSQYQLIHTEVITFPRKEVLSQRLHGIYTELSRLIEQYRPDVLSLENIFYSKNIASMLKIGEARACAILAASGHHLDVVEYQPRLVKQAVSGRGGASKEQVQAMIKVLLRLKEVPPPDASDALAVAICHIHHAQSQKRLSKIRRIAVDK